MKKLKIIIASLAISMIFLGVGYAAWTDSLSISNTVKTGTFDINFKGGTVAWNSDNNNVAQGYVTIDENGKAIVTLENLYPNAVATITIKVKNDGTIPAHKGIFNFSNVPEWLTIETLDSADTLSVGEEKNYIFKVIVNDNAPQDQTVTFTAEAIYKQFNIQ